MRCKDIVKSGFLFHKKRVRMCLMSPSVHSLAPAVVFVQYVNQAERTTQRGKIIPF